MRFITRHLPQGLLLIALCGFVSALAIAAGGVKIIANPSIRSDAISSEELKSIFLEETSSLSDGSHAEPVVSKGGPTHEAFTKNYLGKSDAALQTYYRCLVFTGKGSMPKIVNSEEEMVAYVARTRGAIGYISAGASAEGVKTLQVK